MFKRITVQFMDSLKLMPVPRSSYSKESSLVPNQEWPPALNFLLSSGHIFLTY